jgi:hypothetical protein
MDGMANMSSSHSITQDDPVVEIWRHAWLLGIHSTKKTYILTLHNTGNNNNNTIE